MAIDKTFNCPFCDGRVLHKEISLEEHVSHAGSHLGRAQRHLQTAKEHHAEIGNYAGFSKAESAGRNPHVVHHLVKSAEHVGRADEQQKMAVRHLNALTGNPDYGENQVYKDGERATHDAGQSLLNATDHMHELAEHAVAPVGETSSEQQTRLQQASHHHAAMGQHIDTALTKMDDARTTLDASLNPVEAQQQGDPDHKQEPAQKALTVVTEVPKENLSIFKTAKGATGFRLFVPIEKMEKAEMPSDVLDSNGKPVTVPGLMVKGYGSVSEYIDSQGDLITGDALIEAVQGADNPDAWCKFANIREMHKAEAIGTAPVIAIREHPVTKTPALWIEAFIVDKDAINKFISKTYRGFSIGGSCLEAEPLDE